jgi:hypothetical protein
MTALKTYLFILLLTPSLFANDQIWLSYGEILKANIVELSFTGDTGEFSHNAFNYKGVNQARLQAQIKLLKTVKVPSNRFEKLAFWINAYNFFTIVDVTSNLPVKSMKDIGWKKSHHNVNGINYSLDHIEHKIIRPMLDPRIHFAVNCASVSCPGLKATPFTSQGIRLELSQQTQNALKNPLHLRLNDGDLTATKLFDWFGEDFDNSFYKNPEGFIKKYAPFSLQKDIELWIDYNWQLNTPENVKKALYKLKLSAKE